MKHAMTRLAAVGFIPLVIISCSNQFTHPEAHAILTHYVLLLQDLGHLCGSEEIVKQEFSKLKAELEAIKSHVPKDFYTRYNRLLQITHVGPDEAQQPTIAKQIKEFLIDVTGQDLDLEREVKEGLLLVGPLLLKEVLNLHMILDGTNNQKTTWKKYLEKMLGPYPGPLRNGRISK